MGGLEILHRCLSLDEKGSQEDEISDFEPVVFVAIDFEFDVASSLRSDVKRVITEIGIAKLDMRDLQNPFDVQQIIRTRNYQDGAKHISQRSQHRTYIFGTTQSVTQD